MENLSLLIYTNQTYLPIARLCAEQINKNLKDFNIKKYITSNSFDNVTNFDNLGFQLIDTGVKFNGNGRHFSEVLINSLEKIDSKYVLLFLEDYFVVNPINIVNLKNLVKIMVNENIHYLSLMSYNYDDWESIDIDYNYYGLPNNILTKFNYSYFYMFSVQPSIWNKESLINILKHNIGASVHDFDTTKIKNKKGVIRNNSNNGFWDTPEDFWDFNYNFACLRKTDLTKNYAFDERDINGDYLLFLYSEVIRFGRFNFNTHHNNKQFLNHFLKHKNITKNDEDYYRFF